MRTCSALLAALLIAACSAQASDPEPGEERGPCYGNGTCNEGLVCASDVCVMLATDAGVLADGGSADSGTCARNTDCPSAYCRPTDSTCAVPSCTDTLQNGDETDEDCGGACGATCEVNSGCLDHGDCISGFCHPDTSRCAPCSTFAHCGGPNNVQEVSFCEHCFARPETHVCEAGLCRSIVAEVGTQTSLQVGFTVPAEAAGARSVVLAAILPVDGSGGAVTCADLLPGRAEVFADLRINTTNATTTPLNPPGDPKFAYATATSADPGEGRLLYLGVTTDPQGTGTLLAEGCLEGIRVRAGETHNLTIELQPR